MEAKDRGYLTDVAYLRTFAGDLGPPLLRLAAALNGFEPPPGEAFDYCELGSGNGDTTAALAAANPGACFVGIDVNPEHVAFAVGLAGRAGLSNVRFLERDLEDPSRGDLQEFDFICAHGLLSWISPEKRRAAIAFAEARLKPGGLFYVSYNALPGWAAVEPLRRLVIEAGVGLDGGTLARAHQGLALATVLRDARAAYFTENPAAAEMVDTMTRMGLPYVAHEYLQPHWHPMYFTDVASEMAASGLYFVGQLPVHLNYRDLSLPPALVDLFKGITNRVVFESMKDYALNEFFRRDVFVKGTVGRSDEATRRHLEATPFGTLVERGRVRREVALRHYTLEFAGPIFDALIPLLSAGAASVLALSERPELASFGLRGVREAVFQLVLGGQVVPMQRSARASPTSMAGAGGGRWRVPLPYNRAILEQRLSTESPIILASPVAGTGVVASTLEAASIRLLTEADPSGRDAWIHDFVARNPLRLKVGDRSVEDRAELRRLLGEEFERFQRERLEKFLELGILERA